MPVHIDFEGRSGVNLPDVGAHEWAAHPDCRVLCAAYSIDGEEPRLWWPWFPLVPEELDFPELAYLVGEDEPEDLFERIREGDEIWAHNAAFERTMFEVVCGPRMGWPVPDPRRWRCTMALCAAHALPSGLENAAKALGLTMEKDGGGSLLMKKMAKPRRATKGDGSRWHERAEDMPRLFEYCRQDVRVEMAIHAALPDLPEQERRVYFVDQQINRRGFRVDRELCQAALNAADERKGAMLEETYQLTEGEVSSPQQVAKSRAWLLSKGEDMADLRKDTVERALLRSDLDDDVREFLELRQACSKSSVAKFHRFLEHSSSDGRVRGDLIYHKASTGRWAGAGTQPQNFPRGFGPREQEFVIRALLDGGAEWLYVLFGNAVKALTQIIRGAVIPSDGRKFVVGDFNAVEARTVAWLAGQDDFLKLYESGVCLYCQMAAHVFGGDPEEINRLRKLGDPAALFKRKIGKALVLGCGYQMGAPKFVEHCKTEGIDIEPKLGAKCVRIYRERADKIVAFWADTEAAAIEATRNPGKVVVQGRLRWHRGRRFLQCLLPSGRKISYFRPSLRWATVKVAARVNEDGTKSPARTFQKESLHYWAWRKNFFGVTKTFGGTLTENVTQAVARDLLAHAAVETELRHREFWTVLHAHDELVTEAPVSMKGAPERLEKIMESKPAWASGLPVKAEAWEGMRYGKQ